MSAELLRNQVSEKMPRTYLEAAQSLRGDHLLRLFQQYKGIHWSKKILIGSGLSLMAGAGLVTGGVAGAALFAASAAGKAIMGGLAGYATYSSTRDVVLRNQHRNLLRHVNPNVAGLLAGSLVAFGVGRALSQWGESWSHTIQSGVNSIAPPANAETTRSYVGASAEAQDGLLQRLASWMSGRTEDVDYSNIWDSNSPVLFIGDTHGNLAIKDELTSQLSHFREMGMTHLAVEMFESNHQKLIDGYMSNSVSRDELIRYLTNRSSGGPGVLNKYLEIIDTCKAQGISIVGIDKDVVNPIPGEHVDVTKQIHWASQISNITHTDPNARVVVFGGANHSGYDTSDMSTNELLRERFGVQSKVVDIVGGRSPKRLDFFSRAVALLGLSESRFQVKLDETDIRRDADYVVHLPQGAPLLS